MRSLSRARGALILAFVSLALVVLAAALFAAPVRRAFRHLPAFASDAAAQHPRFGCDPGPSKSIPPQISLPVLRLPSRPADGYLLLDGRLSGPPIAGVGLNVEPTLWTCDAARVPLEERILDTFRPPLVRVGLAQAPWVPDDADSVDALTWDA
jgi:hypothetical protein